MRRHPEQGPLARVEPPLRSVDCLGRQLRRDDQVTAPRLRRSSVRRQGERRTLCERRGRQRPVGVRDGIRSPATPTIYDDRLYVGERAGYHAVTLDGERAWYTELHLDAHTCPTVTSDHVYTSALYRNFKELRRGDGTILRKTAEEPRGELYNPRISSPVLESSTVILGAVGSPSIRAIDRSDFSSQWGTTGGQPSTPVADPSTVYIGTIAYLTAVSKNTGERRWTRRVGGNHGRSPGDFLPAVTDDVVYIGGQFAVLAFDKQSGDLQWQYETGRDRYSSITADEETVYCGTIKRDQPQRESRLLALDRASGTLRWEIELDSGVLAPPTVVRNAVFVECASGTLYAISLS